MKPDVERRIRETFDGSNNGRLHFGEVIGMLGEAGVESYLVDYRGRHATYYLLDDATLALPIETPEVELAQQFDAQALVAAIRGAQRGEVMYPEFKRRSMLAGCVGYVVWLAGSHVTYFGRRGETHVERFPD